MYRWETHILNFVMSYLEYHKVRPLLFIIYVNDLPSSLHYAIPYMLADNTKCAITINHSLETNPLQSDLVHLSTWSSTWSLLFNESKFFHIRKVQDIFIYII